MLRLSPLTQYKDKMGREFSMIFDRLNNDWASALIRYKEFLELFGNTERVKLLNAIGGGLFWDVQQMSRNDLILRLTRLTDPPQSASKDNLTVQRLPALCDDLELRQEVCRLVQRAVDAAGFARDWRNRYISHSDLTRAIDPSAEPLAEADLQKVKAVLDAVHAVLNTISVRMLGNGGIRNDVIITPRARAFLAYARQLVDAVQYVDSLIDPSGTVSFSDTTAAATFLHKLDRRPEREETKQVIELREAARMFR